MKKIVIGLLTFWVSLSSTAFADIVVISNNNVKETALSKKEIREIFLGKRLKWKDNSKIHFVTLKNPDIHESFLKKYMNRSKSKWRSYWKRMIFTGKGVPPKQFDTTPELVEYVAKTKGAIGYVDFQAATVNVKIVDVR